MKKITIFQLHDSGTEEIIGAVAIVSENEGAKEELIEGWEDFNKLQEHDKNPCDECDFIVWFNDNYMTQISAADIQFIQH